MRDVPPEGTRAHLPAQAAARAALTARLRDLYALWGYATVEVPALERYREDHPRSGQSFKLTDRDGGPLALRSDFTPALARLVRYAWPHLADPETRGRPHRFQYAGPVWHAIDPELARTREFTQVGVELVGVSHARADAELIHLARESVRAVGLRPRVEIGAPGFVKALMDEAGVPDAPRPGLAAAIDRKDPHEVAVMVDRMRLAREAQVALRTVPDLYGGIEMLDEARAIATGEASRAALDRLGGVLAEFEDDSELILDLGMARRLSYYTGVTFRAYTVDFGQPLLGGGRYDGALLPYAAGFSIGLERLMGALPAAVGGPTASVLATDDAAARRLRAGGVTVVRSLALDRDEALAEARACDARWLVTDEGLEAVPVGAPESAVEAERRRLQGLLEGSGG